MFRVFTKFSQFSFLFSLPYPEEIAFVVSKWKFLLFSFIGSVRKIFLHKDFCIREQIFCFGLSIMYKGKVYSICYWDGSCRMSSRGICLRCS